MFITKSNPEPATINWSANNKKFVLNNFVYIPILKNAHRYTTTVLRAYDFELNPEVNYDNKTIIVVLRDPIERWFAGVSQLLYRHTENLQITSELINLLTHIVVLDGHSRSQTNFLKGVDTDKCIFFNCDDVDYTTHLHYYCRKTFGGVVDMNNLHSKPPAYNCIHPYYISLKNELKNICSEKYLDRLRTYYESDYELLNNVNFYRGET